MKPVLLMLLATPLTALLGTACSSAPTEKAADEAAAPPSLQSLVRNLPHPGGYLPRDVGNLFKLPDAPTLQSLENCDFDYGVEKMLAGTKEELLGTVRAHIRAEPQKHHWCFYARALKLNRELRTSADMDERKKIVLERYLFFVHLGQIYREEFEDSRYLDYAVANYKRINRKYFGRELTDGTPPPALDEKSGQ